MSANALEYVDISLSRPIEVAGEKRTTFRMREPTVRDQLAMEKLVGTDGEKEVATLSNLCGIAPTDLHSCSMRDYKKLQNAFLNFHKSEATM